MCESVRCSFNARATLTEADKQQLRDIRKHILKIIHMVDELVLADTNRNTIDTFLSRQLELVVKNMGRGMAAST